MQSIAERWTVGELSDGSKAKIHKSPSLGRVIKPKTKPTSKSNNVQFNAGQRYASNVIRSRSNSW